MVGVLLSFKRAEVVWSGGGLTPNGLVLGAAVIAFTVLRAGSGSSSWLVRGLLSESLVGKWVLPTGTRRSCTGLRHGSGRATGLSGSLAGRFPTKAGSG
jgi:hypothetical protein